MERPILEPLPKTPGLRLGDDADEDLLGYIKLWRTEERPFAEDAWREFYRRHVEYVFRRLRRGVGSALSEDELEFIVKDMFTDLFHRLADRYRPVVGPPLAAEAQRRRVRGWLCRIGLRRILDQLRKRPAVPVLHLDDDGWDEVPSRDEQIGDEVCEQVRALMQRVLTERELDVLRWSYEEWYDRDDRKLHPTREGARALAARWETTTENIRAIRDRAMAKLEKALREEMPDLVRPEPIR